LVWYTVSVEIVAEVIEVGPELAGVLSGRMVLSMTGVLVAQNGMEKILVKSLSSSHDPTG
jgi:hypothetical protein